MGQQLERIACRNYDKNKRTPWREKCYIEISTIRADFRIFTVSLLGRLTIWYLRCESSGSHSVSQYWHQNYRELITWACPMTTVSKTLHWQATVPCDLNQPMRNKCLGTKIADANRLRLTPQSLNPRYLQLLFYLCLMFIKSWPKMYWAICKLGITSPISQDTLKRVKLNT